MKAGRLIPFCFLVFITGCALWNQKIDAVKSNSPQLSIIVEPRGEVGAKDEEWIVPISIIVVNEGTRAIAVGYYPVMKWHWKEFPEQLLPYNCFGSDSLRLSSLDYHLLIAEPTWHRIKARLEERKKENPNYFLKVILGNCNVAGYEFTMRLPKRYSLLQYSKGKFNINIIIRTFDGEIGAISRALDVMGAELIPQATNTLAIPWEASGSALNGAKLR